MATPFERGIAWLLLTAVVVATLGLYAGIAGLVLGLILTCGVAYYLLHSSGVHLPRLPRRWHRRGPPPQAGMMRGYKHPDLRWRATFYIVVALLTASIIAGAILNLMVGVCMALGSAGGYIIGRICYGARHDQHR